MKRQIRKQLKTDKFAQDVGLTFSFLNEHRAETIRYGLIGLAVVLLGTGYYFYSRHQAVAREDALAAALKIDNAIISANPTPTNMNFPTQAEKDKARTTAFSDLFTKYPGTSEGSIGGIFIGAEQSDKGNFDQAAKIFKDVVDTAPKEYSAEARVSLAHIYAAQGKTKEAEDLLRYLVDHPTALISKEEATLELADVMAKTDRAAAEKLIQPLTTPKALANGLDRTAVSKAALSELARIQGKL